MSRLPNSLEDRVNSGSRRKRLSLSRLSRWDFPANAPIIRLWTTVRMLKILWLPGLTESMKKLNRMWRVDGKPWRLSSTSVKSWYQLSLLENVWMTKPVGNSYITPYCNRAQIIFAVKLWNNTRLRERSKENRCFIKRDRSRPEWRLN